MNLRQTLQAGAVLLLLAALGVTCHGTWLPFDTPAAPEGIVTLELARAPADAAAVLAAWKQVGGEAALVSVRASLRWDNAFIPCYVALFLGLGFWTARRAGRQVPRPLLALPVVAGLLDYLENWGMAEMLSGAPPQRWSNLVARAASFKFLLLAVFMVFILMNVPFLLRRQGAPPAWLDRLAARWRPVRGGLQVVKVSRWSVLGVLVAAVLLTQPGQDLFRGLDRPGDQRWWLFLGAALLWAVNLWYWARTLLSVRMSDQVDEADMRGLATWLPRLLGFVGLGLLAAAVRLAARRTGDASHETLVLWSHLLIVVAVAFLAAVTVRRPAARRARMDLPAQPEVNRHRDVASLPPGAQRFLAALLSGAALLLAVFWISPQWGPRFGSITIALLAASLWIPLGSLITYFSLTRRVPAVSLLVIWAIAISPCTDNRHLQTQPRNSTDARPLLDTYLQRRLAPLGARAPVYIVTAEGGGIRAAYWTAAVLGWLQDKDPRFAAHLVGISAVSGGSVGAAVFGALLADGSGAARAVADSAPPERTLGCASAVSPYRCAARAILSHDYLAANLAALLFPDLLQRFLPLPLPGTDRARAFESTWQAEWSLRARNARLSQPFERLWDGDATTSPVPALFLNATQVETGLRAVWSPVRFDEARVPDLIDALDALSEGGPPATVSLATAAHASARFPYVSPAGRISASHLVDGGYFENSGAATGLHLLSALGRQGAGQPIVIALVNSLHSRQPSLDRWANDLLAPPLTLFRTRDARAVHSESVLDRAVQQQGGCMIRIDREPGGIEPPLSWVLSGSAQKELDRQLDQLEPRLRKALAPLSGGASPCAR